MGLAPAAHGANRTGRVFTGDGSGDFLMAALHRTGFASIPTARRADDGLRLSDAYILSAARCAPPDNKPLPEELIRCRVHLDAEVAALPRVQVVVALGKIAFDAWLQWTKRQGTAVSPRPPFGHGVAVEFAPLSPRRLPVLLGCYHPQPAEHEHWHAHAGDDGGRPPIRRAVAYLRGAGLATSLHKPGTSLHSCLATEHDQRSAGEALR